MNLAGCSGADTGFGVGVGNASPGRGGESGDGSPQSKLGETERLADHGASREIIFQIAGGQILLRSALFRLTLSLPCILRVLDD